MWIKTAAGDVQVGELDVIQESNWSIFAKVLTGLLVLFVLVYIWYTEEALVVPVGAHGRYLTIKDDDYENIKCDLVEAITDAGQVTAVALGDGKWDLGTSVFVNEVHVTGASTERLRVIIKPEK
jgi:hypothetical protein